MSLRPATAAFTARHSSAYCISGSNDQPTIRNPTFVKDNDGDSHSSIAREPNPGHTWSRSAQNNSGAIVSPEKGHFPEGPGIMAKEAGSAGGTTTTSYHSVAIGTNSVLPHTEGTPLLKKSPRMAFTQHRHITFSTRSGSMPAAHGSHDLKLPSSACEVDEMEFPSYWDGEPSRTPIATAATQQNLHEMGNRDRELMEHHFLRALELKPGLEDGPVSGSLSTGGSQIEKPLMMKYTHKVRNIKAQNTYSDNGSEAHLTSTDVSRPMPQDIPHIHIQAVTPPDSKPLQQERLPRDEITTGRPSPVLAPIASRQCLPPVTLVPTNNRLPRDVNLATPEYTLVNQHASLSRQVVSNDTSIRAVSQKETADFGSDHGHIKYGGGCDTWTAPVSENTGAHHPAHSSVTRDSPVHARQDSDSHASVIPNSTSQSQFTVDAESYYSTIGESSVGGKEHYEESHNPTVVIIGHDCPPENYIHEDFTKESLRRKWEYVQSWTQWPKLKGPDLWSRRTTQPGEDWCDAITAQGQH